ncbi:hypothetical protein ALC56_13888 [Trachymyrmex septentrionalis]|uniref:Uncharacterized protein n=1 Tax=Trachymyrmex septentrionalis TaxID=34720 RepID=A0A195EV39_9HYME|nr:hypothetical protein ALC56_13888 [Trachymyrmex septentrionalis]
MWWLRLIYTRERRIGKRERGSCGVTGNCRRDESGRNPVSDFVGNLRSRSRRYRNIYGEKVIRYSRKKVATDANTSRQSLQKYRGIELLIRDDDEVAPIGELRRANEIGPCLENETRN